MMSKQTNETVLGNGERVAKDDLRIEVLGNIDELSAAIGLVRAHLKERGRQYLDEELVLIQKDLQLAGANVALCPNVQYKQIRCISGSIDLSGFVITGENMIEAQLHFARTVCRRTERSLVALSRQSTVPPELLQYFNRLSGLLFELAVKG